MKRLMIVLMMIFLLSACEKVTEELSYDDFEHLEEWREISGLENGQLFVYYYSPYCLACQSIKEVVLAYADAKNSVPLYLMLSDDYRSQGTPPLSINSIPALLIFEDHQFDRMLSGSASISAYLKSA